MEYDSAKLELSRQAGIAEDYYEKGFVPCLRPYSGIREDNFHFVVESVFSVGDAISSTNMIERRIVHSIWHLTTTARRWGIDDDGMLARNKLISPDDRLRLRRWITIIEAMMLNLLDGLKPHNSIHSYCEYVAEHGWGPNFGFFVPLLSAAIDSNDVGDTIQGHCEAIIPLGSNAIALKDTLGRERRRKCEWYEPQERCVAEMLN